MRIDGAPILAAAPDHEAEILRALSARLVGGQRR